MSRDTETPIFSGDAERIAFVRALLASKKVQLLLSESAYLTRILKYSTGAVLFNDMQREAIDCLFEKYGGNL